MFFCAFPSIYIFLPATFWRLNQSEWIRQFQKSSFLVLSVWFGAYSTNNWWSHCCIFMRKRMNSSEGDVLIRIPHSWEGFWEKQRGESADNNSGIVGYYFGSLAQTESSCCPAAEPKQPRPPAERRREKQCVCVCACVCVAANPRPAFGSTVSFWFGSCWREERERERGEETQPQSSLLGPTLQTMPSLSLSLSHFLFFTQTFCPESPEAASSIFPIISYLWRLETFKGKERGVVVRRRRRRSGVCGKRKKEKEREAERGGKERVWETESPGPRVHNKGASVPAPGPAGLRGGWRMKEENEDKEEEEGPQERALAWDPWPALISRKTGSTLTWALAAMRRLHLLLPPLTPSSFILLLPNWAGVSFE